jgi:3-oxoacyl-[acyl-carrier protein] reductase
MTNLTQSVTLVTGSTKGIGYAIAETFARQGARVIVHGRDPAQSQEACEEMGAHASVAGDLSTGTGCQEVLDQLAEFDEVVFLAGNGAVNGSALRVEGGIIRSL